MKIEKAKGKITDKQMLLLGAAIIVIAGFFYSQRQVAFMIHDDMYYCMVTRGGNILNKAKDAAIAQGRFYYMYTYVLYAIPYLFNSMVYIKAVSLISVLFSTACLFYVVKKMLGAKIGFLVILILYSFAQIDMQHNAFVAYLFHHQVTIGILLLAIERLLAYYREKRKTSILVASAILYAIPVFIYESFLFYSILFFAISLYFNIKDNKKWFVSVKDSLWQLRYHIILSVLYLIIYFTWMKLYPSVYEGSRWAFSSLKDYLVTVAVLSTGLFPLNSFIHIIRRLHISDFLDPYFVLKAIISSAAIMYLLREIHRKISAEFLKTSGMLLLLATLLPSIPLALTSKYVSWVKGETYGYVVSYFSYFFIVVLITLCLIFIYQATIKIKIFKILLFGALFIASVCTDVNNAYWAKASQSDMDRRVAFDKVISSPSYQNVPDGSVIYIPDYIGINTSMNLTAEYVKMVSGKTVKMENKKESVEWLEELYAISYDQPSKSAILYQKKGQSEMTKRLSISSVDDNEKGILLQTDADENFMITENGKTVGIFYKIAVIPLNFLNGECIIESDSDIQLESIQILNQQVKNNSLIKIDYGEGFYEKEDWGRWSQKDSQLNIINNTGQDHVISFYMLAGTGYQEPSKFEVILPNGSVADFELNNEYREIRVETLVHPGVNELQLVSSSKQVDSGTDSRKLFFKVSNSWIEIVD